MSTSVRTISAGEIEEWLNSLGRSFFMHTAEGKPSYYLGLADLSRTRAALDGDRIVATMRSFPTSLTVPGPSEVDVSALTAVSVAASHRRRGLLRQMMRGELDDAKARGEVASILLASEYPIYGRYGYGAATRSATYEIDTEGLGFLRETVGTFEIVELAELRAIAPTIYDRFRSSQPGAIGRDEGWWDRATRRVEVPGAQPDKGFQCVYRGPGGEPEGYASYVGAIDWSHLPLTGDLQLNELVSTTPDAYQALWAFAVDMDLQSKVVAHQRPCDEVLPLLVEDARKIKQVACHDFLWVRLLDVAAALGARRYATGGAVVIEVRDQLGLASGTFALDGGPDGASCVPSTATADLSVTVGALSAAYLGGEGFARLAAAGLAEERRAGAVDLAHRMFTTARAPWCTTFF